MFKKPNDIARETLGSLSGCEMRVHVDELLPEEFADGNCCRDPFAD
jgi:hypothetical protein